MYKKECAEERRNSFAFLNAEGARQREQEVMTQTNEKQKEHERFELKIAGERGADEYEKNCANERRESFVFCNADGRRHHEVKEDMMIKE